MGTDVEATTEDIKIARMGVMMQLAGSDIQEDQESLEGAIKRLGLGYFIENEIRVIAHLRAEIRNLYNIVHGVNNV